MVINPRPTTLVANAIFDSQSDEQRGVGLNNFLVFGALRRSTADGAYCFEQINGLSHRGAPQTTCCPI